MNLHRLGNKILYLLFGTISHALDILPYSKNSLEDLSRLRATLKKMPKPEVSIGAGNMWFKSVNEVCNLIEKKDQRGFLSWKPIRRTMFVGNNPYIIKELNYLKKNWKFWEKVIQESRVGSPRPFLLYPKSSGNLIHQAYHMAQFEKVIQKRVIDSSNIFEFGGGYGCMCRAIHNAGFRGKYILFDFPIISALQNFYLKSVGLGGVRCLHDVLELKKLLLKTPRKDSLFIATWSLSESPLEVRKEILELAKSFDYFLFTYQKFFDGVDNKKFFHNFTASKKNVIWYNIEIPHLPDNYYLFGKKL